MTDARIRELADNLAEDLNGQARDLWWRAEAEAEAAGEIAEVIRRAVDEAVAEDRDLRYASEFTRNLDRLADHIKAAIEKAVAEERARLRDLCELMMPNGRYPEAQAARMAYEDVIGWIDDPAVSHEPTHEPEPKKEKAG